MSEWTTSTRLAAGVDPGILEETAIATAQATIQNAINDAGISRAELARQMGRPRSFITRMLCGSHNLTVRTMARALAACGFEPQFAYRPVEWGLVAQEPATQLPLRELIEQASPAHAGTPLLAPA